MFKIFLPVVIAGIPVLVSSAPSVQWDAPDPFDPRISRYEIHCVEHGQTIPLDGTAIITRVDHPDTSVDLENLLELGKSHDCVATSYSLSHGLRSVASNLVTIDMSAISPPQGLHVSVSVSITVNP